jgi:hypothetical protein
MPSLGNRVNGMQDGFAFAHASYEVLSVPSGPATREAESVPTAEKSVKAGGIQRVDVQRSWKCREIEQGLRQAPRPSPIIVRSAKNEPARQGCGRVSLTSDFESNIRSGVRRARVWMQSEVSIQLHIPTSKK